MATQIPAKTPWSPTCVRWVSRLCETSTCPLHVMTDAGWAYVKTLGNPEGPDALVSEWIGTKLAAWMGLPTFDIAVVDYPDELRTALTKGCVTQPGPAFAARAVGGRSWDGTEDDLEVIENPEAMAGLVVFDMWTRNWDRYAEDGGTLRCNFRNVFFSEEGARKGRNRLLAMDHTECFRTGHRLATRSLFGIDAIRDERLYGLFPAFRAKVTRKAVRDALARLAQFREHDFGAAASGIPAAWDLRGQTRDALKSFCVDRAKFLVGVAERILEAPCRWQPVLPGTD